MTTTTPFYFDWGFWQGTAAVIALIVSVTPHVLRFVKGNKLEIESHDLISLTHTIGNPNINLFLILRNTGGAALRVKSIYLQFKPRDGEIFQVSAQSFFPQLTEEKLVIFAPFKLSPGEDWAHTVYFYNRFSKSDDQLYRQIISDLRVDLDAKKVEHPDEVAVADPAKVNPITQFFERKFKWVTGEYDVYINVVTDSKLGTITKQFRMTIYESDSHQLRSYTEGYKIGLGAAYFDVNRQSPVAISLDSK